MGARLWKSEYGGHFEREFERQRKLAERATKTIQERLDAFTSLSARVFAAGTAGILGMVAAASPATFETFTGSVKLLSAELGQSFIPIVAKVSYWIQRARDWVHNLDDATKTNLAKWVLYGVASAGAVVAIAKVVDIVSKLIAGVRGANAALAGLGGGAALAGITAMAAALGVVAYNLNQIVMSRKEFQAIGAKTITQEMVQDSEAQQILGRTDLTNAQKKKAIDQRIREQSEIQDKAIDKLNELQNTPTGRLKNVFGLFFDEKAQRQTINRTLEQLRILKAARDTLEGRKLPREPQTGGPGLLTAFGGPQPQVLAIENLSRAVQLAALSTSPLESETLRLQQQGNEKLDEISVNTRGLSSLNLGAGR